MTAASRINIFLSNDKLGHSANKKPDGEIRHRALVRCCWTVADQAAARARRRARRIMPPTPPKPISISAQVFGSGTPLVSDTESRSATGGWPFGVPIERNDRTWLVSDATKVWLTLNQPAEPPERFGTTAVSKDWPPKLTCSISVVSPVRSANWAAAQSKLRV